MIYPMLAKAPTKAKPFTGDFDKHFGPDWVYEPKYDGMRIIASGRKFTSRIGTDSTLRFPEVRTPLDTILDGEMVMFDGDGNPDFNLIQRRTPKTAATDSLAKFVVFDILECNGEDLRTRTQRDRRMILETLDFDFDDNIVLAPQFTPDLVDSFYAYTNALNLEGIIAKNQKGLYYEGHRTKDWIKIKRKMSLSCLVTGWEDGLGKRESTFGALNLSLFDGDNLVDVGNVGTGFTDQDLEDMKDLLSTGQKIVVEIECMEVTKDRQLRHPVYKGVRDDVPMMNCTIDQLV